MGREKKKNVVDENGTHTRATPFLVVHTQRLPSEGGS